MGLQYKHDSHRTAAWACNTGMTVIIQKMLAQITSTTAKTHPTCDTPNSHHNSNQLLATTQAIEEAISRPLGTINQSDLHSYPVLCGTALISVLQEISSAAQNPHQTGHASHTMELTSPAHVCDRPSVVTQLTPVAYDITTLWSVADHNHNHSNVHNTGWLLDVPIATRPFEVSLDYGSSNSQVTVTAVAMATKLMTSLEEVDNLCELPPPSLLVSPASLRQFRRQFPVFVENQTPTLWTFLTACGTKRYGLLTFP